MPKIEGQSEKLWLKMNEAMESVNRRHSQYLTGIVLVERESGFSLVLLGSDRNDSYPDTLVRSLRLYWPDFQLSEDGGIFFGMSLLPVTLGGDGFTKEELARIQQFIGTDGKIVHTAGYDYGLVREMNPEYQEAKGELLAWFGRGLGDLASEMRGLSDELIIGAMRSDAPEFAPGGGFCDLGLTALMEIASKPSSWSKQLQDLHGFVSSRLVGPQGHPFEDEVMDRALVADADGRQPFGMVNWAKRLLERSYCGIDRGIIFGLKHDLMTLLAPGEMRQMMMRNILKGSNENVAERILWYNAIRALILEYLVQSGLES
ncbi:hypothetical protein HYU90_01915 [Candidatus Collierbacteria bacterium]|nr:hypothetical protein [Candidatus Collierbacteria bacterium]